MIKSLKLGDIVYDFTMSKSSILDERTKKLYQGTLTQFKDNMLLLKKDSDVGIYLTDSHRYVSNQNSIYIDDVRFSFVGTYEGSCFYVTEIRKRLIAKGVPFIEFHSRRKIGDVDRNTLTFYVDEIALKVYIRNKSHRRGMDLGKGITYIIHNMLNESGYRNGMSLDRGILSTTP